MFYPDRNSIPFDEEDLYRDEWKELDEKYDATCDDGEYPFSKVNEGE